VGLSGNSKFYFLKKCRTVFQSSYNILRYYQQCMGIPFSPHPYPWRCLLLPFLFKSHPSRCEGESHCGFDLHFPMNNGVEHLFHVFASHLYIFFGK